MYVTALLWFSDVNLITPAITNCSGGQLPVLLPYAGSCGWRSVKIVLVLLLSSVFQAVFLIISRELLLLAWSKLNARWGCIVHPRPSLGGLL